MSATSIIPLSRKEHANLTYSHLDNYSFTENMTTVPLINFEIVEASECFPIIFPDPKRMAAYAVLGLGNKNIFVDKKGNWKASSLPLMLANHPFSLVEARFTESPDRKPEFAIGIVKDAPEFAQKNGKPLYNDKGEPSEALQKIQQTLGSQLGRSRDLQPALDELASYDFFDERSIVVESNGKKKAVNGFRCVNHEKFFALPEADLGHFVKTGVMGLIYAHWQSMRNLPILLEHPSCPQMSGEKAPVQ